MKEGIARNRLERLEKEEDEEQVQDKDFTRCVVRRWMLGKGSSRLSPGSFTWVRCLPGRYPKLVPWFSHGSLWTSPVQMLGYARSRPTVFRLGVRGGEAAGGDSGRAGGKGCQAGRGVHTEGGAECEGAVADAARACD